MNVKKAKTSALAVLTAAAIALSGTFAWQSISQMALNEAKAINPGGRLHDDFSGYNTAGVTDKTKDIYVENFGSQPIYARVRLDEYMEIGAGAGLKTGDEGYDAKTAESLVAGKTIDDPSSWTTHIPSAADPAAPDNAANDPFHTYWTWAMGGSTVYMPTFNKNQDSLKADINGTLAGLDKDPTTGVPYDDYVKYTADTDTATGVRDTDPQYAGGAAYDCAAEDNTTDECGPYGGAGGTGVAGTNYEMKEETHTAANTLTATVITMAEYTTKTPDEKKELNAWVYDVNGWAYWSQAIQPGTATGLLLDGITLTTAPTEEWYYAINAVGQFITADDLGRDDNTGFYTAGSAAPTTEALALLKSIGVKTEAALALTNVDGADLNGMTIELKKGGSITLKAASNSRAADWNWTVDAEDIVTLDSTTNAQVTATVQSTEGIEGKSATITVTKGDDASQSASLTITVVEDSVPVTYTADVKDADKNSVKGGTVELALNSSADFTPSVLGSDGSSVTDGTWTWTATPDDVKISVANGKVTVAADATEGATATITAACAKESLSIDPVTFTVKAVAKATPVEPGPDVPTPSGDYTVTVKVKNDAAAEVTTGGSLTFTATLTTKDGSTINPAGGFTFNVTGGTKAGTAFTGDTLTVATDETATTLSVTAQATFGGQVLTSAPVSVSVIPWKVGDKSIIDGDTYIITAIDGANALMLKETVVDSQKFHSSSVAWSDSDIKTYLNGQWLNTHTSIRDNAKENVTLSTWNGSSNVTSTDEKVFLLSTADVFGTGADAHGDYTYGSAKLAIFTNDDSRLGRQVDGSLKTWWLRSANSTTTVRHVSSRGTYSDNSPGGIIGVRPAFWYPINKLLTNEEVYAQHVTKIKNMTPEVGDTAETVTINDIEWYVVAQDTVNHRALLLSRYTLTNMAFDADSQNWASSDLKSYLNDITANWNSTGKTGFLNGKSEIIAKAAFVDHKTRQAAESDQFDTTNERIFLLSSADVCGQHYDSTAKNWVAAAEEEYTFGKAKLSIFASGSTADTNRIAKMLANKSSDNTWWLRSPGVSTNNSVTNVADGGNIDASTPCTSKVPGVRPAFWYDYGT